MMKAVRFPENPLIRPEMLPEPDGANINGPSLIRAPGWLPRPLGKYYLYFAHHQGRYIRLAYANDLRGPWSIYVPGSLRLEQTPFKGHIASPDVLVDEANRRLIMYYHGCCRQDPAIPWVQYTCVAFSSDGVHFESASDPLCQSYLRMFRRRDGYYGIAMPGQLYRSADGLGGFEPGPMLAGDPARHFAVGVRGDVLHVFYSRREDCPERILYATVALSDDWTRWRMSAPASLEKTRRDVARSCRGV